MLFEKDQILSPLLIASLSLPLLLLCASGCAFDTTADKWEFLYGPTNINAALGNGGLSAAFSGRGEITVLRWPSPSYYDQLSYMTRPLALEARKMPRMGADENMGIFAGLAYFAGGQRGMTWLRDEPWVTSQTYLTDSSNVLRTEHYNPDLSVRVTFIGFVLPDRDVLVLRYEVSRFEGSPVEEASLILFENLSPCLDKIPGLPIADWLLDSRNDFAALYDSGRDALVHFRPAGGKAALERLDHLLAVPPPDLQNPALQNPALQDPALQDPALQDEVDILVDDLDAEFCNGVYIAIGSPRETRGHQVGFDAVRVCAEDPPWSHQAEDAFEDASDGTLSGSPIAACQANAALSWALDLAGPTDEVTIYAAFSNHSGGGSGALALLESVRQEPYQSHLEETEGWWADWLSTARLPGTDPYIQRVARRSLISIKTGTDRETGAIVASIATQSPYAQDWPRDGAFINYALDLAGYHHMVTRHNLFYARVQRKEPLIGPLGEVVAQAGTYATNYYADGVDGGPIPFEIDNAGLAVWTMAEHAKFLGEPDRAAYWKDVWPAIRLGAEELAACRDEGTGLQCWANEDDNPVMTRGLQGAIAVYMALSAALEAGREVGARGDLVEAWNNRRDELKEAIIREFWRAEGHFDGGTRHPRRPGSWLIWPARLLPYEDPRMAEHARYLFELVEPNLSKETAGSLYDSEAIMALAHIWKRDAAGMEKVRWALEVLTRELPTEGTNHYSEAYSIEYDGEEKVFVNRNAIPHIWSASLIYLGAMAAAEADEGAGSGGESRCGCMLVNRKGGGLSYEIGLNGLLCLLPPLVLLRVLKRKGDRRSPPISRRALRQAPCLEPFRRSSRLPPGEEARRSHRSR